MDFSWSAEQQVRYEHILAHCRKHLGTRPEPWTQRPKWDAPQWNACADVGLMGLCIAREYGGQGLNALDTVHAMEAFGRGCADRGLMFATAAHLFAVVQPLDEFGTPEQKHRWLPGLCNGECVGGNAITEVGSGSDAFAMQTTATPDGDDYLLDGEKSYVTNASWTGLLLVYATTNPMFGALGVTAFLVPRDTPGVTVGAPIPKIGLTTATACRVTFNRCRVPAVARLGAEGQGATIFQRAITWERVGLFAAYLGILDQQLERCLEFAQNRKQFRRSIGEFQAISHRLVNMKLRLESSRLLAYRAAWELDQGRAGLLESALSKISISEAAVQSSLEAIQIHGAAGVSLAAGIEADLRDAIPSTIFSGTSEVMRNIAAIELGLVSSMVSNRAPFKGNS